MSKYTPTLNESIKMITANLMHSMQLADVLYGTVIKVSPLEIQIDQKFILTETSLILSNMVKDHYVDMTVSMQTENDAFMNPTHTHGNGNNGSPTTTTSDLDTTHKHEIKHKIKVLQHYGLKISEKVILLRMQGGQRYLVLDRIEEPMTNGEWL